MTGSQWKNVALLTLGVCIAGFAAYRIIWGSSDKARIADHYVFEGICLECQSECHASESMRVRPPLKCNNCGKLAVYPWMWCPDCKYRFVPNLEKRNNEPPAMPIVPTCLKCGKGNGMAWFADDPEQKPAGDVLPKMP